MKPILRERGICMLKFHIRIVVLLAAVCCMFVGCATVDNNYLRPEDFAGYLTRAGIKVDGVRPLLPDPFRATSGCGIMVDGSEIGVYKYDRTSRVQRKRLERLAEQGRTYIQGIPYPIVVRGSFMIMGLEKNKQKRAILRVFDTFK